MKLMTRLLTLSLAITSGAAMATTVRPVSVESMAARASLVAEGTAVASWSQWNAAHTMIVTYTRFRVSRALKGAGSGEVTLRQPGGTVGPYTDVVHGIRYLRPGEEAVVFLKQTGEQDGAMVVVGLMQGMFRIEREASGSTFVSNGVSGVESQDKSGSIQTFRGTRIPLAEFEARVAGAAK